MSQWIRILELIGGAAFALSGAAAAMEHGLDIFGLLVLALTTAQSLIHISEPTRP